MAWNRSHVEFMAVLIVDVILYFKMTDESYRSLAMQLLLMGLSFVALLMTIVGFASFFSKINQEVMDRKIENNVLLKSYLYLKIILGVLFVFLGLLGTYKLVTDTSDSLSIGNFIFVVLFIGFFLRTGGVFILESYRKLKDA